MQKCRLLLAMEDSLRPGFSRVPTATTATTASTTTNDDANDMPMICKCYANEVDGVDTGWNGFGCQ